MRSLLSSRKSSPSTQPKNVPSISVSEPPPEGAKGSGMSSAFVPSKRRVRFDLTLRILDLNNVPLVSGTSFIKWHLPSSTAAEHRGRTSKNAIRDHRVAYDYEKRIPIRLTVGKDGMLAECPVEFEILQEYSAGGRGERIELGNVRLNLAEYVDAQEPTSPGATRGEEGAGEEGIVRRYLMQDSKINSTLKLGIHMRYVEGSREYFAPPLRTAPVFGGIAGIISSSEPANPANTGQNNNEDGGGGQDALPNLSTRNKEIGEMQDMYRRTLAAFWASQPGELKADECIEDIFAGGDGWGSKTHGNANGTDTPNPNANNGNNRDSLDGGSRSHHHHRRRNGGERDRANSATTSGTTTPRNERDPESVDVAGRGEGRMHAQGKGMLQMARKGRSSKNFDARRMGMRKGFGEVDEFEIREDLRSWRVGEQALG